MRKAILFTLLCALCMGITGCGAKSDPFISIVCSGNKTVSLGMTQQQMEKVLGEKGTIASTDASGTVVTFAKSSISVTFGTDEKKTANQVMVLTTDPGVKTGLGISLSSTKDQVKTLAAADTAVTVTEQPGIGLVLNKTVNGKNYKQVCTDMGGSTMLALMIQLSQ